MDIKNFVRVDWRDQRVLTSAQLAEAYECSVDQIKKNFSNNKKHYKEGVHYFKIAGEPLNELRGKNLHLQISPMTRVLYLWTYQGCVRHCKSINTPKAWAMFDKLEKHYFNQSVVEPLAASAPVVEQPTDIYRVYLFLLSDGNVKIGFTKRFLVRISEVKRETGLSVTGIYFTPEMPYKNARIIERCCKEVHSDQRVKDEIYSAAFAAMRASIEDYTFMAFATLPNQIVNIIAEKKLN